MSSYLILISSFTFVLFGWDKLAAKLHSRRIPVATLIGCCLASGVPGGWCGMLLFRHKTRDRFFIKLMWLCTGIWLIPLILYLQNKY